MTKNTYTGFCQDVSGEGTIWIDHVNADNEEDAMNLAREACANDWDFELEQVHVLGLAEGNINILFWEDLNTD